MLDRYEAAAHRIDAECGRGSLGELTDVAGPAATKTQLKRGESRVLSMVGTRPQSSHGRGLAQQPEIPKTRKNFKPTPSKVATTIAPRGGTFQVISKTKHAMANVK